MAGCACEDNQIDADQFDGRSPAYKRALIAVIAINAVMFLVEMSAGYLGSSQALKADALDFAGDTATYALSFAVIGAALRTRATAALIKGASLGLMALFVLTTTVASAFGDASPVAPVMSGIGFAALAANVASVFILLRWRDGDSNVRSVWLCSRNDAIGNVAVIAAGAAVWLTGSFWPDLIVAALLASLFARSACSIIAQSMKERRASLNLAEGRV
ncbi:cation transporter [Hyphococcus sp.]|uniref:cation transporter n=1 Tax=Hyphococcus sp. TaxID=2038636 RepID=UPI003CCC0FA9